MTRPPTSEKARRTSMRRRSKSMSDTRRAVASPAQAVVSEQVNGLRVVSRRVDETR